MEQESENPSSPALEEKPKSLKKNYVYNLLTQLVTLILPLLSTPYVSRILHETGVGQYSFSYSLITYFVILASLGFGSYAQREIARCSGDRKKVSVLFWEIFIVRLIPFGLSAVIFLGLLFSNVFRDYTILMEILSLNLLAVCFDVNYIYQGEENFRTIAFRNILVKVLGFGSIFIFVKTENDTWIYTLCLAGANILGNISMWISLPKMLDKVKRQELHPMKHLWPSARLFIPTIAVSIYTQLDKTIIGLMAQNPDYQNGCYEQAYKVVSVLTTIVTAIGPIMIPRNASDYAKGDYDKVKDHLYFSCNYVWMLAIPIMLGVTLLSKNICSWYLGDGYEDSPLIMDILSVLLLSIGLNTNIGTQYLVACKKDNIYTISVTAGALVNMTLNIILIPHYGAVGAAIGTIVAETLIAIIQLVYVSLTGFLSIRKILVMSIKPLIAGAIMFASLYFIRNYFAYSVGSFFLLTFIGAVIYFAVLLILKDSYLFKLLSMAKDILLKKKNNNK